MRDLPVYQDARMVPFCLLREALSRVDEDGVQDGTISGGCPLMDCAVRERTVDDQGFRGRDEELMG
jgi:hypothetical protein